jgi:hypothetical protein
MQRAQEKREVRVEEAEIRRGDLAEFWGAIGEALGATMVRALQRVLEARGGVPEDDLESLERALETMKDLLGPRAGEILEEYAVQALQLVDRDPVEP